MPDRLLAVTLALVLALPFFVSLDDDLFDQDGMPDPAAKAEAQPQEPEPAPPPTDRVRAGRTSDAEILKDMAREVARRFSLLASEALGKSS